MSARWIDYTQAGLERLVGKLPPRARWGLSLGPLPDSDGCRICETLTPLEKLPHGPGPVATGLLDYHAGPDQSGEGPGSWACCVRVYRAAGWQGDAAAPDR